MQYAANPNAIPVSYDFVSDTLWIAVVAEEDIIRRNSHNRNLRVRY